MKQTNSAIQNDKLVYNPCPPTSPYGTRNPSGKVPTKPIGMMKIQSWPHHLIARRTCIL